MCLGSLDIVHFSSTVHTEHGAQPLNIGSHVCVGGVFICVFAAVQFLCRCAMCMSQRSVYRRVCVSQRCEFVCATALLESLLMYLCVCVPL